MFQFFLFIITIILAISPVSISPRPFPDFFPRQTKKQEQSFYPVVPAETNLAEPDLSDVQDAAEEFDKAVEERPYMTLHQKVQALARAMGNLKKNASKLKIPEEYNDIMDFIDKPIVLPGENPSRPLSELTLNPSTKKSLQEFIDAIKDLKSTKLSNRLSSIPKPLFLSGPPGAGKTFTIQSVAKELGAIFVVVKTQEIAGDEAGAAKLGKIADFLTKAECFNGKTVIVLLDEIDCIARNRGDSNAAVSTIVKATALLKFSDKIKDHNEGKGGREDNTGKVFFMAAANYPIDKAFMDRCETVTFRYPGDSIRRDVIIDKLKDLFPAGIAAVKKDKTHWLNDVIDQLTRDTKNLSIRDIEIIVQKGAKVLQAKPEGDIQNPYEVWFGQAVRNKHAERRKVLEEILLGKANFFNFTLPDIQKASLEDFRYSLSASGEAFQEVRAFANLIGDPKKRGDTKHALLLYGPPGTGKTAIAKSIARAAKCNLITVNSGTLLTKFQGSGSESLMTILSHATDFAPCLIFFDEIDAIGQKSDEHQERAVMRITLQTEMTMKNDPEAPVFFMGATNYREQLESAFRDRFLRQFEIKNPNFAGRIEILCNQLRHELKGDERVKEYLVGILSKLPILRHLYVLVDQQLAGNTRKHSVKFATFPPGRQLTNVAQNVARFIKDNYFNGRDQQTYTAQSLRFIPQNAWGALFKAALKKASITTTNNPNEFKQEVDKGARKVYSTGDAALIEAYDGLRAIFDESLSDRKENKFIDIPAVSAQELARRSDIFEQVCSKFDKKNPAYAVTKDLVTNDPFAPQASAGFREYVTQLTQSPDFKSIFARSGADFGEGVGNLMLDCIKMIDQAQKAIDVYQDAKMAVYAKYAPDNPEESDDDVADPADVYLEDAASEDGSVEYQDEAEPPLLPSATRTGRSRIVQPEADLSSLPFWPEAMEFLQRYPDVTRIGNEGLIQLANSGASLALLMQDLTSPSSTLAKKFFELIDGKVYLKRDEPLKALMAALRTQVPAL